MKKVILLCILLAIFLLLSSQNYNPPRELKVEAHQGGFSLSWIQPFGGSTGPGGTPVTFTNTYYIYLNNQKIGERIGLPINTGQNRNPQFVFDQVIGQIVSGQDATYQSTIWTNLEVGATYTFFIAALYELAGSTLQESTHSNEVTAIPFIWNMSSINSAVPNFEQATINWVNPTAGSSGAIKYFKIYRDGELKVANVSGTSYVDEQLSPGIQYTYQISVVFTPHQKPNEEKETDKSNIITVRPYGLYDIRSFFAISEKDQITLRWNRPYYTYYTDNLGNTQNVSFGEYKVFRKGENDVDFVQISRDGYLQHADNRFVDPPNPANYVPGTERPSNGSIYEYRILVVYYDINGSLIDSYMSDQIQTGKPYSINPPRDFAASPYNKKVELSWRKPDMTHVEAEPEYYEVYRSDKGTVKISDVAKEEFNAATGYFIHDDVNLTNDRTYNYRIRAIYTYPENHQTINNPYSEWVTVTPYIEFAPPDSLYIVLNANNSSNTEVLLFWEKPIISSLTSSQFSKYSVWKDDNLLVDNITNIEEVFYRDSSSFTNSSIYTYYVKAHYVNPAGENASISISVAPLADFKSPVNIRAVTGDRQVIIYWNAPSKPYTGEIDAYEIYRNNVSLIILPADKIDDINDGIYINNNLTNGFSYTYYLVAKYKHDKIVCFDSPPSESVVAIPEPLVNGVVFNKPRDLTARTKNRSVTLSWVAPENQTSSEDLPLDFDFHLTGYKVYRNGEMLVELPNNELSFTYTLPNYRYYTFNIVAVYNNNHESLYSNSVLVQAKRKTDGCSTSP